MDELTAANLSDHLNDQTFVEYFNAFLLLPTFSHRVFYNSELGLFEEVSVPQKTSTVESVPHVLSPTSSCSLILTDDNFVATLDKHQCWVWVVKERLPLFIKSDLYSQYKLCKILSSPSGRVAKVETSSKPPVTLGLGHRRQSSFPGSSDSKYGQFIEPVDIKPLIPILLREGQDLDYSMLDSKVSMGQFRRFLRGTAGEKYWFFWLDVERARYLSKSIEQLRLLRELRDKYLKAGGNFELPAETRRQMGITKLSKLSLDHLNTIQKVLIDALRSYWSARFLLHYKHRSQEYTPHIRPQTCYGYGLEQGSQDQLSPHPNRPRSHSLSSRPTPVPHSCFSKETSNQSSPSQQRPQSSSLYDKQPMFPEVDGRGANKNSVSETRLANKETSVSDQYLSSGKIWERRGHSSGTSTRVHSRNNRTLRYMVHHFPQLPSREPSAMSVRSVADNMVVSSTLITDSSCQIMSVSGTPLPNTTAVDEETEYKMLLKFLSIEQRKAGGVFQRYLEDKDDELSLNCLMFWRELQYFKNMFVQYSFNPCCVEMTAKGLYGKYIVEGATDSIACSAAIRQAISNTMLPPYEDLFDLAEEHTLKCLLTRWIEMSSNDSDMFRKMERAQSARKMYSRPHSRMLAELDEESDFEDDDTLDGYPVEVGLSRSLLNSPEKKPWALSDILQDGNELDHFKIFLNEQFAAQDLMCWMEIEQLRSMPIYETKLRDLKARQIRKQFFNKGYFFGPQSPASKEQQLQVVCAGGGVYGQRLPLRPSSAVFREAQKYVRARLEKKWLPMFLETPEFKQRHMAVRQGEGGRSSVSSAAGTRVGELGWMANSREAILFRRALQDNLTCANFIQYLAIKQESEQFLVNNVLFWLEVQRYKEMYHNHTMPCMLENKMSAIINCYLLSPVPPRLQLDIPQEVAEKVTKKDQIGPYVFREAQVTVFRDLFSYWGPFQEFAANNDPEKLPFKKLEEDTKEQRESLLRRETAYEQYLASKRQATPRFETEDEKHKRIKEEAKAKEMADVAIVFRLSEPSPLYETVRVQEAADPNCIKVFTPSSPKAAYSTDRRTEQTSCTTSSKETLTRRPQTCMTRSTSKTVEVAQARPTTSLTRPGKRQTFLSVPTSTEMKNYSQQTDRSHNKPITGNKITFETHTGEEDDNVTLKQPKSKRLLKMKFSSGTSNYRYAEGLDYNSDMKIIVT